MPAKSQAQRGFLAHKFGVDWMREHHFTNKGKLPQYVKHQAGTTNVGLALFRAKMQGKAKR
jgi:hypothetical protein